MRLALCVTALMVAGLAACRPSDVLSVGAPAGVLSSGALENQAGAEGAFDAAKAELFFSADGASNGPGSVSSGLLMMSGLLTDEFTFSGFTNNSSIANVDARVTTAGRGFSEPGDIPWKYLLEARSALVVAIPGLERYEPATGRSMIGEAYALAGYAELLIAESYCAGTPLSEVVPGGAVQYGGPLTTDSLLGVAVTHFDSALAEANGDAAIEGLAGVGLGRALLSRGQYMAAAAAAGGVPTPFTYNAELPLTFSFGGVIEEPNPYAFGDHYALGRVFNVADQEGTNGLNFVSAHDPRLAFDTTLMTWDGASAWYLPLKFEANFSYVPLATGIEARLIEAEAALQANAVPQWLGDLNALRNGGCSVSGTDTICTLGSGQVPSQTSGLPSLADPGTDSARVSLMFRERAFWLFGTGTRLGDLRRLVRQYGRDASTVFPTGQYANGSSPYLPAPLPQYGTDVSLTLPTPQGQSSNGITVTNPHYKGCIASTMQA